MNKITKKQFLKAHKTLCNLEKKYYRDKKKLEDDYYDMLDDLEESKIVDAYEEQEAKEELAKLCNCKPSCFNNYSICLAKYKKKFGPK